ncbi:zinc-ribbon domain-containing protein [Jeotgalibaca dankookensis]|uniref:zinc-ribbon domain-containing protein n=1 Tax=Jeotgalibaca dankookensis TaxID=708126 RepID=UPI000780AD90|nr:zinc-ribbon domain-containing protein [Jeotgalibaca dankookensis]
MFIFLDVHPFEKKLDYYQTITCDQCGHFGRYEVFQLSNRMRLFFIPVFTFGKQFIVRTTCCGTVYQLADEVGKAITKGESVSIELEDLTRIESGVAHKVEEVCPHCGYHYAYGANYCPNCGQKL